MSARTTTMNLPENRSSWFHLHSLWLFTKNDFKTAVLPQAVFAIGLALSIAAGDDAASHHTELLSRAPLMLAWSWLHLLVFNVGNQRRPASLVEDSINKPWRPIASGRLSPDEALPLLRVLVLLAVIVSIGLDNYPACASCMIYNWLYNDLDGDSTGPVERNFWNAIGLGCLGWGSAGVLLGQAAAGSRWDWMLLMGAVIFTTVHAQDMEDMEGDLARGRKTPPLVYGEKKTRLSIAIFAILWSVVCPAFWRVAPWPVSCVPLALGCGMAFLTTTRWDRASDVIVWKMWCVWMAVLYILPAFGTR
ncbi:UbiA prenyltransferase family [Podospora australis]|uniref:UbiA prenyltransferase family n=1 Tax=Podospora australis TaxID=1536484 RepID=A0AAN6WMP1_9PEZI|nr:UbiA prenyltransferase family [Podospora australis]